MVGTTQGDRAAGEARGSASGPYTDGRGRTIRRHPIGGTVVGMEVTAIGLRDASDIERAVAKFATVPNGGLILTASALSVLHHGLVVALAARFKLPTIYYRRFFVNAGGLVSYGYDVVEHFRGAGQRRRHTFICSECHGTERRVVFIKDGRE